MRPLPMSLEPITGESLVSYLLRLAYRLSLPPLHLARMAGWINDPATATSPASCCWTSRRPEPRPSPG